MTTNRLSFYRRTRIWHPTIMTLDGRAASGGMMIYFDVAMIVVINPAPAHPNPTATPVRATVARNYTVWYPPSCCPYISG